MIFFLKYKDAVPPGKTMMVKCPSSDTTVNHKAKKHYKVHREQKFIPHLRDSHQWLRFDEEKF